MHSEYLFFFLLAQFSIIVGRQIKNNTHFPLPYSEFNTWEPIESVSTCKFLLEEFERNLAKQKELKAAQAVQQAQKLNRSAAATASPQKTLIKAENVKPGPSSAAQAG